jgi:hypothetical protein
MRWPHLFKTNSSVMWHTVALPSFDQGTAGWIAHRALLRIATMGYNVSFEKPVVVVHDRTSFRSN